MNRRRLLDSPKSVWTIKLPARPRGSVVDLRGGGGPDAEEPGCAVDAGHTAFALLGHFNQSLK